MLDKLREAGFRLVGEWTPDGDGIKLSCQPEKGSATVYAFVLDRAVVYIGKTETCLRGRMQGYRNGKGSQRTNIRVRGLVLEALKAGSRIELMALSPEPTEWHGLPVNTAVGLEAGLIDQLKPVWNLLNKRQDPPV
jgi:hypothetical protein